MEPFAQLLKVSLKTNGSNSGVIHQPFADTLLHYIVASHVRSAVGTSELVAFVIALKSVITGKELRRLYIFSTLPRLQ